ncbi:MAG: LLM class flavin-dependent oxidoreductase, partial [Thermomicrobiales bacterium]
MQLSVQIEGAQGLTWPIWQRMVSEVEAMGFAGLYCCDHFANPAPPDYASLEVMTAMTYAASHSERMLLGTLVAPVSWRDPVMLARQAMAIDDLSGGRFVLGVGAGWNQRERTMFGYPLGEIPERMARFTEALEVMTRLIRSDDPQTFDGQFYHLHEATLLPHPQRH